MLNNLSPCESGQDCKVETIAWTGINTLSVVVKRNWSLVGPAVSADPGGTQALTQFAPGTDEGR